MSALNVVVGDFNDPHYRQKRKELLDLLTSMGYPPAYANKAIDQVDPTLDSAAELCFHWFEENPMPSEVEQYPEQIKEMAAMGFSREESRRALTSANGDINRAVFYLLADKTKELKAAIREEQAEYERVTRGGPDESSGDTPFDDDSRILDDLKKDDLSQPDPAAEHAPNSEIKALTQQIVQLQELVLTYQNKYLALKRRVAKVKGSHDEEDGGDAPASTPPAKSTPAKKEHSSPRDRAAMTRQNSKHNMALAAASINSPAAEKPPPGPAIRDLARSISPQVRRGDAPSGSTSPKPSHSRQKSAGSALPNVASPQRPVASPARPAVKGKEDAPPGLVYSSNSSSSSAKKAPVRK